MVTVRNLKESFIRKSKFWFYYLSARLRGIRRTYNRMPKGAAVSCGIHKMKDVQVMYFKYGWTPYCITDQSGSFKVDRRREVEYGEEEKLL
ncbi:MAG TPA: hypothetical protein ENG51_05040 [Deltaproteobacteria bacterium]|nr:hypothetical protein [Deltaproteobacteria bacterium]